MKLGLSSYTFGWAVGAPGPVLSLSKGHLPARPLDEIGLVDRCRDYGLSLLQIGDNLPLHTFDDARLGRLAERATDAGVDLEVGMRGLSVAGVRQYAAIARRLNARLIRLVIDEAGFHPTPETAAGLLGDCVPLLEGLTLGIENHDRFPAQVLRQMIASAGSDRLGVCLDTANSLGAGEGLETVLRELGPLTVNLHLKDFQITRVPYLMGFQVEGRPAGQGMLDIPGLLKALAANPRCNTAVLELWTPPEAGLEKTIAREAAWAEESLKFLKPLFAGRDFAFRP